jgi:hypothetical protein
MGRQYPPIILHAIYLSSKQIQEVGRNSVRLEYTEVSHGKFMLTRFCFKFTWNLNLNMKTFVKNCAAKLSQYPTYLCITKACVYYVT